jgi:hypothetical protein
VLPLLLRLDCSDSLRTEKLLRPKRKNQPPKECHGREAARSFSASSTRQSAQVHTHTHTDTHTHTGSGTRVFFPAARSTDTKQQQPRQVKVRGVDLQVIYIYSNENFLTKKATRGRPARQVGKRWKKKGRWNDRPLGANFVADALGENQTASRPFVQTHQFLFLSFSASSRRMLRMQRGSPATFHLRGLPV